MIRIRKHSVGDIVDFEIAGEVHYNQEIASISYRGDEEVIRFNMTRDDQKMIYAIPENGVLRNRSVELRTTTIQELKEI